MGVLTRDTCTRLRLKVQSKTSANASLKLYLHILPLSAYLVVPQYLLNIDAALYTCSQSPMQSCRSLQFLYEYTCQGRSLRRKMFIKSGNLFVSISRPNNSNDKHKYFQVSLCTWLYWQNACHWSQRSTYTFFIAYEFLTI